MNRTILLDYELIQTAYNTRTTINNDNVSFLSEKGFSLLENSLGPQQSVAISGINGALFIRCSNTLTLQINQSDNFTVNSLFVNFGEIANVLITNNGNEPTNYRILYS